MAWVTDRCICLRKVEYSETSQVLLLFSREHGLQRVIAKGAHRRTKAGASIFDGGADLLDVGQAVFSHRLDQELGLLKEWSQREGHLEIRRNLRGLYLGLYAAELVGLLFEEHDPHPELFDRLEATLTELGTTRAEETFLAFQLDLLRESGYLPELNTCIACGLAIGPKEPLFFSPERGGIVCQNCEGKLADGMPFDGRLLNILQTVLRLPKSDGAVQRLPRLSRHQTDPINRIFSRHLQHTLGKRLRMTGYVL